MTWKLAWLLVLYNVITSPEQAELSQDWNSFEHCQIQIFFLERFVFSKYKTTLAKVHHPFQISNFAVEMNISDRGYPQNSNNSLTYFQLMPDFQPVVSKRPLSYKLAVFVGGESQKNSFNIAVDFLQFVENRVTAILGGVEFEERILSTHTRPTLETVLL